MRIAFYIMRPLPFAATMLLLVAGCAANSPTYNPPTYQVGANVLSANSLEAQKKYAELVSSTALRHADFDGPLKVISAPFPDYPINFRSRGIEGQIEVLLTIEPNGAVSNPTVLGSPAPELADHVLDFVKHWQFAPPMKNGAAVQVQVLQVFTFKLN